MVLLLLLPEAGAAGAAEREEKEARGEGGNRPAGAAAGIRIWVNGCVLLTCASR